MGRNREMPVHIGKEIKAELLRQERGVSWLADKLHCDRTNVYDIFKREGIDTRLLERISVILNRNFFTFIIRMIVTMLKIIHQMCRIICYVPAIPIHSLINNFAIRKMNML